MHFITFSENKYTSTYVYKLLRLERNIIDATQPYLNCIPIQSTRKSRGIDFFYLFQERLKNLNE